MEKLTDKYLWKSLKEGDLNAFAVLFETYYPLLHSYGLKISKNEALTEGSLQDFFYTSMKKEKILVIWKPLRPIYLLLINVLS